MRVGHWNSVLFYCLGLAAHCIHDVLGLQEVSVIGTAMLRNIVTSRCAFNTVR